MAATLQTHNLSKENALLKLNDIIRSLFGPKDLRSDEPSMMTTCRKDDLSTNGTHSGYRKQEKFLKFLWYYFQPETKLGKNKYEKFLGMCYNINHEFINYQDN